MASRSLDDLHPEVKRLAERHRQVCQKHGIDLLIYCTYRSDKEQAQLYAQGRTVSGKIVTNARPGESKHNNTENGRPASLAYDAVPMVSGKPAWGDAALLTKAGELGEMVGLEWAGRWKGKLKESVHFQMKMPNS